MKKILIICSCLCLFACDEHPKELSLAQMEMHGVSWENVTLRQIKRRIKKGDDVNSVEPTKYGWTILGRVSSYANNKDAVKYLLESGADVNKKDKTGATALMKAGIGSDVEIMQMLLNAGADVNARTYDGDTALMYNIRSKNVSAESIKLLLNAGADIKAIGEFGDVFHTICGNKNREINNPQMLQLFLSKGADINSSSNNIQWTPLMSSIGSKNIEVIDFLLKHGADYKAKDYSGKTVAHIAAELEEGTEIIDFLAKNKIPLNTLDNGGRSPIVLAIFFNRAENVEALIKNGVNIDSKYNDLTLLEYATSESENPEVIRVLLKYGVKPTQKAMNIANDVIKKSDVYWEIRDVLLNK